MQGVPRHPPIRCARAAALAALAAFPPHRAQFSDDLRARVALRIAQDRDPSPVRAGHVCLGHGLLGPVGALDVEVRLEAPEQRLGARRRGVEAFDRARYDVGHRRVGTETVRQHPAQIAIRDDAHRAELLETEFKGKGKIDIGRFKGLGEMLPAQLKETTMDPDKRTLLRVEVDEMTSDDTRKTVDKLMGTKADARFQFIQERAEFVDDIDI